MDWTKRIARRATQIEASGIRKIFDLAATLKDPINLSIGQPDFPVPDSVKAAAVQSIQSNLNGYTPSGGISPLREKILERFEQLHGVRPEDVVVTSGVSGALTIALMALVDPGDEVLVPDPYFVSYKHLTTMCGGRPVFYNTYPDFSVKREELDRAVTPNTKVVLAMSPGNPTGVCLSPEEKQTLADFAREKNLILISDEIYELFIYGSEHEQQKSLAAYYPEGTIAIGGLSKTAAITGWRVGWATGPKVLIQEMTKLQQFTFVCAPSFAQHAAMAAFKEDLSRLVDAYQKKRDAMISGLRDAGYELNEPDGAFYLFVKTPDAYESAQAFVEAAAKNSLLLVPGNVFSERDSHFRISYAASDDKLKKGLAVLKTMRAGA